uniref:AP-3 complex subunit delta n=1 Tax=Rhodosorus marinus TaxID=101924 RepID=A0A7S2ZD24_9RHOD|mmetsp:Transcript_13601/g.54505  ORF Transcript_13601/g.54505 Transcript_13601/m.54505 type:complete len:851 (+) Transcript_13601:145-2697(+)
MGSIFNQSLQGLVKGIRSNRRDEESFLKAKYAECTEEARSPDPETKGNALLKLTYLQLFGFNFGSCSFEVTVVMSRPDFQLKRIGYFAAAQSFSPMTDVLLLTTNQFKKDLVRGRSADCSLALSCLAKIGTEEFGRDIGEDVLGLLNSSRPYIRKKATLVAYRLALVSPHLLDALLPKLHEKFDDNDPSVVCAAVTVLCELAGKYPREVLQFSTELYGLLSTSRNNWVKIKVVKLMGRLCQVEQKFAKKLVSPMLELIRTTEAKALLYECCSMVTTGMLQFDSIVEVVAEKLGSFIDEKDQNLKYLGLSAMTKLARKHPKVIRDHRDLILDCFHDEDVGIRLCALDLITSMITKKNLREVCRMLLKSLASGIEASRDTSSGLAATEDDFLIAVANRLMETGNPSLASEGSPAGFKNLITEDDFSWYISSVLFELAQLSVRAVSIDPARRFPYSIAGRIANQFVEIPARVDAVRKEAVERALRILDIVRDHDVTGLNELVSSAAFVVGENSDMLELIGLDEANVITALLNADVGNKSGPQAQLRIVYACLKIFARSSPVKRESLSLLVGEGFSPYLNNPDPEVQERATEVQHLIKSRLTLSSLFKDRLRPRNGSVQALVTVPAGLDIDEPLAYISDIEEPTSTGLFGEGAEGSGGSSLKSKSVDLLGVSLEPGGEDSSLYGKKFNEQEGGVERDEERPNKDIFYLATAKSQPQDVIEGILLNLDGGQEPGSPSKIAEVFFSADELKPSSFHKEDYSVLKTPTGSAIGESALLKGDNQIPSFDLLHEPDLTAKKAKKKKKKKRKKKNANDQDSKAEESAGGSRGDLLIDFNEGTTSSKPQTISTDQILDLLS